MLTMASFQRLRSLAFVLFLLFCFGLVGCEMPQSEPKKEPKTEVAKAPEPEKKEQIKDDQGIRTVSIAQIEGTAYMASSKEGEYKQIEQGQIIKEGQFVKAGKNSVVSVCVPDGSALRISSESVLAVEDILYLKENNSRNMNFKLLAGKVWVRVSKYIRGEDVDNTFNVGTESISAGVRGTVFQVEVVNKTESIVRVYSGKVAVSPPKPISNKTAMLKEAKTAQVEEAIRKAEMIEPEPVIVASGSEYIAKRTPQAQQSPTLTLEGTLREYDQKKVAQTDKVWLAYNLSEDRKLPPQPVAETVALPEKVVEELVKSAPQALAGITQQPVETEKEKAKKKKARRRGPDCPENQPSQNEQPVQPASPPPDEQAEANPPSEPPPPSNSPAQATDEYMNEAGEMERQAVEQYYRTIQSQMKKGKWITAQMNLENYIMEHPGWESIIGRYYLGVCFEKQGKKDKAITTLKRALKKFPKGKWASKERALLKKLQESSAQ